MESPSSPISVPDLRFGIVAAPFLGIGIASLTGMYRGDAGFWTASAWFTLMALVIWEGNRVIWRNLREKPDWLDRPGRRLFLLAAGTLTWSAGTSILLQMVWAAITGVTVRWTIVRNSTAVTLVAVAFIVQWYEIFYLIAQRKRERAGRSTLEVARAKAELAALTAQVDPHFVFNSLHTIVELNEEDPRLATDFVITLADVYRYVVLHGKRDLVPLAEELGLLEKYASLLRTRFGDGIHVRIQKPDRQHEDLRIPPVSLQTLLENAVKHNRYTDRTPLEVSVELKDRAVVVRNQKRPLARPARSAHSGLLNLDQRCRLMCGPGIAIEEDASSFAVVVPLA